MCNNNNETKAKEFFIFSYFNIVPKGLFDNKKENNEIFSEFINYKECVAYKCAYRAYLDVCRTIKYSVTTTEIKQDKKKYNGYIDLKKAFIDYEINLILTQLNNIPNTKEDFDTWHNSLCDKMRIYNNNFKEKLTIDTNIELFFRANKNGKAENSFQYGMAQKLLNMTIKNLLLAEDMFSGCTGYEALCHKRELFHVSVDKNTLNAAKSDFKIKGYLESWSSWDETTYVNFIKALRIQLTELNPKKSMLDWEHSAWMEFAE